MNDAAHSSPASLVPSPSKELVHRTAALVRRGLRSLVAPPERILDFPDERSIGTLYFQYDREDWFWQRKSCEARGLIRVPANEPIRLEFRSDAAHYVSVLAKLGPNDVQRLFLAELEIDDSELRYLSHLTGLLGLYLSRTPVSDAGLEHLSQLSALDELHLSGTKVGDQALRMLRNHEVLVDLSMSDTAVGDAGLAFLPALQRLEELDLSRTQISDAGASSLADLTSLKELDLSGTRIGDVALKQLQKATWLEWLTLTATRVTDAGMDYIANLVGLHHLQLGETLVTDRGVSKLRALANLASLDLSATGVTAEGLLALQDLPQLGDIDVTDTGLSEADVDRLRKVMPHLSNVTDGDTDARCAHCGQPNHKGSKVVGDLLTCRYCKTQYRLGEAFRPPTRDQMIQRTQDIIDKLEPIPRAPTEP